MMPRDAVSNTIDNQAGASVVSLLLHVRPHYSGGLGGVLPVQEEDGEDGPMCPTAKNPAPITVGQRPQVWRRWPFHLYEYMHLDVFGPEHPCNEMHCWKFSGRSGREGQCERDECSQRAVKPKIYNCNGTLPRWIVDPKHTMQASTIPHLNNPSRRSLATFSPLVIPPPLEAESVSKSCAG
jgi:hypothetical protein